MRKIILGLAVIILSFFIFAPKTSLLVKNFSRQSPLPVDDLSGNYNYGNQIGEWEGKKLQSYPAENRLTAEQQNILGLMSTSNKRIEVDLTNQKLYAFENDTKVFEFPISSGLYNWTPTGEYWIWTKLKYTLMKGGNKSLKTYYYLPNVPYTMYFENDQIPRTKGYGIHGAYWHNDFGRPKSHGCINLKPSDAEQLYYWAEPNLNGKNSIKSTEDNPGTKIIIYGQYQG